MAPIGLDVSLPEIDLEIFFSPRYTGRGLPISHLLDMSEMDSNWRMPMSPQPCDARPLRTSRQRKNVTNADPLSNVNWNCFLKLRFLWRWDSLATKQRVQFSECVLGPGSAMEL